MRTAKCDTDSAPVVLGIDTSNYTTSVALVDRDGGTVADVRRLLEVKRGERGLRQQEALFQHIKNLPELLAAASDEIDLPGRLAAVAVSTRPRPQEGSYMPVFLAGETVARSVATAMAVPLYTFSHQEGHIAAAAPQQETPFHAFHLSGGTCELLSVRESAGENAYDIEIVGGTRDISFGQLLDRIGVFLGLEFPAGSALDTIALAEKESVEGLPPIRIRDRWIHLAGAETAYRQRLTEADRAKDALIRTLFEQVATTIAAMTEGLRDTVLIGGVSESAFIRQALAERTDLLFSEKGLGQDNAVGMARLGSKALWQDDRSASIN